MTGNRGSRSKIPPLAVSQHSTTPASSNKKAAIIKINNEIYHLCPVVVCNESFCDRKKLSFHCLSTHSTGLKPLEGFMKKTHAEACRDSRAKINDLRDEEYFYESPVIPLTCQSQKDREKVHASYIFIHRFSNKM
jgi:hypothetical protein